jgi:hypothetical protein
MMAKWLRMNTPRSGALMRPIENEVTLDHPTSPVPAASRAPVFRRKFSARVLRPMGSSSRSVMTAHLRHLFRRD